MMELLAPAGGMESVVAAVQNGANAVYLGQQRFNARQNAENFTTESLKEAVRYCHRHGVKVYQTFNILVYDRELAEVEETLKIACEAGIDALIVQDLAVIELAKKCCPRMRLHGSTQMTVHTPEGARFCEELGLKRIVLARELSIPEIAEIARSTSLEIEVFVHGALCMSVSGQCTMSAMIGTRSGNRGSCAGSCRLPFGVKKPEDYDLSLKDLCAVAHLKELEKAGVCSLKIEGRMKRPEYVAAATAAYAQKLQGLQPDFHTLEAVFSRSGFTDGYLTGKRDGNMFGTRQKEDVLAAKNVLEELHHSYQKEKQFLPLTMKLTVTSQITELQIRDPDGHMITVSGEASQKAQNRPLDESFARSALEKLGGTPYRLDHLETAIEDGRMLPKSQLNELRRRAVEALDLAREGVRKADFTAAELSKPEIFLPESWHFCAHTESIRQFLRLRNELDLISLPLDEILREKETLFPYASKLVIEAPRVLFGREAQIVAALKQLKEQGFEQLAVSNLAHIQIGKQLGFRMFGTHFLNVTNRISGQIYRDAGVQELTLSAELTAKQFQGTAQCLKAPVGAVLYGNLPVMIVRNCPVRRERKCSDCGGRSNLKDRKGNSFPVLCHEKVFSEVLNCQTLWLGDRRQDFSAASFGVLYFTRETPEECFRVLQAFKNQQTPAGPFTRGLAYRGTH